MFSLKKRVIVTLDMDCYYAQCEQKRLNIDENIPLAVRQWNGIVAVNYAARAQGVKMSMNIVSNLFKSFLVIQCKNFIYYFKFEALKLCPNIKLPHADTFQIVKGVNVESSLD